MSDDLMQHFADIKQRETAYESWVAFRSDIKAHAHFVLNKGMSYDEAQCYVGAILQPYSLVNPSFCEAGQYFLAEVYDRVREWRDE